MNDEAAYRTDNARRSGGVQGRMRGTLRAEEGLSHLLSSDDEGLSKAMGSSKKDPNFINTLANKRLNFIINDAFQSRIIIVF